jgi:hypothetical protein
LIHELFAGLHAAHGQVGVDALTRRLAPLADEIRQRLVDRGPRA